MMVKIVPGLTEEWVAKWKVALEDPEHQLRLRVYFLAARKRYAHSLSLPLSLDHGLTRVCSYFPSYKVPQAQDTEVIRRAPLPIRLAQRLFSAFLPSYWAGRGLAGAASWFISLSRWR